MPRNDESLKEFALEQLSDLPDVDTRYMFGGWAFYLGGRIFGIIADGAFYFKADDAIKADLGKLGSAGPFEYAPGKIMNGYWEAPMSIVENRREFQSWSKRASLLSTPKAPKKPKAKAAVAGAAKGEAKAPAKKAGAKAKETTKPVAKKPSRPAAKAPTAKKPAAKKSATKPKPKSAGK